MADSMFIGEYEHSLDEKGRFALPTKFRAALGHGAVVTRGLDRCLFLYPEVQWRELAERLIKLPISQAKSRAFARLMLAGAMDVQPDGQGRIVVPDYLRTYARMQKRVVVAGLYNRLELWDRTRWERYKKTTETRSGDIAEALGELGV